MINKKEVYLPWITGFYEGEGTCGYYLEKKRGTTRLIVGITQKESEILVEAKQIFGYGSVAHLRKGKIGEVHTWWLSGYAAENFLETIMPYMRSSRKYAQAASALNGWRNRPNKKSSLNEKRIKATNQQNSTSTLGGM